MNLPLMFGEWLRQRRDGLGLTRKEFALCVGCSVSMLRKIEEGERQPSRQIAELIANCLNLPMEEREKFVRVARGELTVARLFSSVQAASSNVSVTHKTNLPVLPTSLIGRQKEISELLRLLNDPQCRLITLVGVGGIGKTRLAIETASRAQDAFADGVYFAALAPVNATRFIAPMIANALGFSLESANRSDPQKQLFNYLKEKQILFVIDNLEHLLNEPGVEILSDLLVHAPKVKLLATSRESLGLQSEWVFEVHGLPILDDSQAEMDARDTSVELFIQRARRANVSFQASAEDFPFISSICRSVDGMPLAIEIAAGWTRTLSCAEISKEIERDFNVLSNNMRDVPERHRSMRAVFDHSWKLLAEDEQNILRRLSVFRGGFTREAAEEIVGANFTALLSLVTKSLVYRSGDHRYDMHGLIRQYALEQLMSQPIIQKETQERHARYYVEFFANRVDLLRSPAQVETAAELVTEMENFRAAWDWAIIHRDLVDVRRVPVMLWHLFELRNWFEEGVKFFSNAVSSIESSMAQTQTETSELLNELKACAAYFVFRQGNTIAAYDVLSQINTRQQSNMNVYIKLFLGIVCRDLGKFTEANEALREGLEISREYGDLWSQSIMGQFLGVIAIEAGAFEDAHHYLEESLVVGRMTGDPLLISHGLGFLSMTFHSLSQTANAEKCLQESLALTQKIGYRWGVANALEGLGRLAQLENPGQARELFAASSEVHREIGDLRSLTRSLCHQTSTALALGEFADAQTLVIEALTLARQCDFLPGALEALTGLASLYAKQGETNRSLELALVVLDHPAALQEVKDRTESLRVELESQLPQQQYEAAFAQAQTKSVETVMAEILN